jgi:hypothetical protein
VPEGTHLPIVLSSGAGGSFFQRRGLMTNSICLCPLAEKVLREHDCSRQYMAAAVRRELRRLGLRKLKEEV